MFKMNHFCIIGISSSGEKTLWKNILKEHEFKQVHDHEGICHTFPISKPFI